MKTWNSICLQGSKSEPYFSVVINGKRIFSINEYPENEFKSGKLDIFKANSYVSGTFGAFTDFNVWNKSISIYDIDNWFKKNTMETKTQLSWKDVQLELNNLVENEVSPNTITDMQNQPNILFKFYKKSFHEGVNLCKNLGGHIPLLSSSEHMSIWRESVKSKSEQIWLSFTDERLEGNFIDIYTGYYCQALI